MFVGTGTGTADEFRLEEAEAVAALVHRLGGCKSYGQPACPVVHGRKRTLKVLITCRR